MSKESGAIQQVPAIHYDFLFHETQIAYCASSHTLYEQAGALTIEALQSYEWVWPSHPLPEMQAPTTPERMTVLTDSMDSAALFILSGQHLGFLPQHYASPYEQLDSCAPLTLKRLAIKSSFTRLSVARPGTMI